ncbi:MAG: hypothetical protein K2M91_15865, partial [Lachnospiraceae bacterium]|nr:hypothetical protein [Lachnospiraceae bacterium]
MSSKLAKKPILQNRLSSCEYTVVIAMPHRIKVKNEKDNCFFKNIDNTLKNPSPIKKVMKKVYNQFSNTDITKKPPLNKVSELLLDFKFWLCYNADVILNSSY